MKLHVIRQIPTDRKTLQIRTKLIETKEHLNKTTSFVIYHIFLL